ncbi:MAG: hypothetical protein JSR97_01330 [Verrucomicrobia bacterium]|nr:hypothetical protein [Verrucomicrobiota bacterium]
MKLKILLPFLFFATVAVGQKTLHLYGGQNQDVYLGCLNCSDIDQNSIWNDIGTYGSNINSKSIWNDIGTYGSDISNYSPFNSLASYPPAIVDKDGNFYGYLTTNDLKSKRAEFKLALTICKYYKDIQKDVSGWYKKIFN